MNMIVDAVVLGLIVIFALAGLVKGFYKSGIGLFGTGLSLAITYFITGSIAKSLLADDTISGLVHGPFSGIADLLKLAGADASAFASTLFGIVVFFVTYLIVRLLMMIVTMVLKHMVRDKDENGLTRLLGFIIGAARGAVFALMIMVLAVPFYSAIPAEIQDQMFGDSSITGRYVGKEVMKSVDKFIKAEIGDILGTDDQDDESDEDNTTPDDPLTQAQATIDTKIQELFDGLDNLVITEWVYNTSTNEDLESILIIDPSDNTQQERLAAMATWYGELDGFLDNHPTAITFYTLFHAEVIGLPTETLSDCADTLQAIETWLALFEEVRTKADVFEQAVEDHQASTDLDATYNAFVEFKSALDNFFNSTNYSDQTDWTPIDQINQNP